MFNFLNSRMSRRTSPESAVVVDTTVAAASGQGQLSQASSPTTTTSNTSSRDGQRASTPGAAAAATAANTPTTTTAAAAAAVADISQPSSASPRRMSKDSEGYPSWLPKRPPPPAPGSTFHSSSFGGYHDVVAGPSEQTAFVGGRKPTPRSVRIVSLQEAYNNALEGDGVGGRREPTDQTRVSSGGNFGGVGGARVWSRATGATLTPGMFNAFDGRVGLPQPRFNARGLNLGLLRNPSTGARIYFYLFPIFVFAHIPLQSFLDYNVVFMLLQVSKFPDPQAPGVPGSGKNWALGAAAYIACWLTWIFVVFLVYELIYSFARRWRVKRPLILPLYLSSPAFNLVSMSSYSRFCFMQHTRISAFLSHPDPDPGTSLEAVALFDNSNGSLRNGLAETCWFYSQNLPTIALLLPRAGLSIALLLAFSTPQIDEVTVLSNGLGQVRDGTYFRRGDGTLNGFARGVLFANVAWAAWRLVVVVGSWVGLWILSGQGCGGICGPRDRWEEEEVEKSRSVYSETGSDLDAMPWSWREGTRLRIQEAYDFCLTIRPTPISAAARWGQQYHPRHGKQESSDASELLGGGVGGAGVSSEPFEGMEQVLAAVGFPSIPPPARRGILTEDLFESPKDVGGGLTELSSIIPKVVKRSSKDKEMAAAGGSAPLLTLPYPFTMQGAHVVSSRDRVPFPPSPVVSHRSSGRKQQKRQSGSRKSASASGSGKSSSETGSRGTEEEGEEDEEAEEAEDDEDDEDEEDEDEDEADVLSDQPSSGRASGSMSSLGRPISSSRYPFQIRRPPGHGRGNSLSSGGAASHMTTPSSNARSGQSRMSQTTQSTGNRESTDSQSPRSYTTSAGSDRLQQRGMSASPSSIAGSGIPMPPRHPQQAQGRGRVRVGTSSSSVVGVVVVPPLSPSPVAFPSSSRTSTVIMGGSRHPPHHQHRRTESAGIILGPYGPETDFDASSEDGDENEGPPGEREEGDDQVEDDDDNESEPAEPTEVAEREDVLGLLSASASVSPRTSLTALRNRSRTLSQHRLTVHSNSSSRSRSHSHNSSSSGRSSAAGGVPPLPRSRTDSLAASVRSRTHSMLQGLGAASQSSLELVQGVLSRSRTHSHNSMARLADDEGGVMSGSGSGSGSAGAYLSDATHSRSGSSGGENNTFGHPLRTHWQSQQAQGQGQSQERVDEEEVGDDDELVEVPLPRRQRTASGASPLRQAHSADSISSHHRRQRTAGGSLVPPPPALVAPFSSASQQQRVGVPIPAPRAGSSSATTTGGPGQLLLAPRRGAVGASSSPPGSASQPDISTAAQSFVTAPATVDGATTTGSSVGGRTVSSWDAAVATGLVSHMGVDRADETWRPA